MGSERLLAVLDQGARLCLPALSAMGAGCCEAAELLVGEAAAQRLQALVDDFASGDCHGVWLSAPSAAFLALFSRRSALWLTERFAGRHVQRVDLLAKRDSQGVSEIASILVNALLTPLAEAQGREIVLSAPQAMLDNKRELLARALACRPALKDLRPAGYVRLLAGDKQVEIAIIVFLAPEIADSP